MQKPMAVAFQNKRNGIRKRFNARGMSSGSKAKGVLQAIAVLLSFLFLSTAYALDLNVQKSFNIPAQPLSSALIEFGRITNVQVMTATRDIEGLQASAVQGTMTLKSALQQLLAGTKLEYQEAGENSVTISKTQLPLTNNSASGMGEQPLSSEGKGEGLRLSRAGNEGDKPPSATGEGRGEGNEEKDVSSVLAGNEPSDTKDESKLQEVIVTGSHIRGTAPIGSEMLTIGRRDLEKSGYGRLQDVLEILPQNFASVSEDFSPGIVLNSTRGAEIQLRGLGPGTTLTLVNGHRQPAGGIFGAFTDIASIPSSAIERVEVLPDGASAIYGSDAIGGVVNIILRKDFRGAESQARFATSGGEANDFQLAQLLGTVWNSGHAMVSYQYSKRDALLGRERPYSATSGDLRGFGGDDFRAVGGVPGTILDPATFAPVFAIPAGQDGTQLTPDDLLPGVNYIDQSSGTLLPKQELHGAFVSASQEIGGGTRLNLDARYSVRDMTFGFPLIEYVEVTSVNPFYVDAFGTGAPYYVIYDFSKDLGMATQVGTTRTFASTLSATKHLADDWTFTVSGTYGRETNGWQWLNRPDFMAAAAAVANPDPAAAFNVFGDGSYRNPSLAGLSVHQADDAKSRLWSAAAVADGVVFDLPSGPVRLALGADYRDERQVLSSDFTLSGTPGGKTGSSRNVSAVFAELNLPLLPARELELSLAGRRDDYSDFGSTFNPKVGMSWRPSQAVRARTSWGTSFRAPPFYLTNTDLRGGNSSAASLPDPASSNGLTRSLAIFGTAPGMKEETSNFWSAGIDLTPAESASLSLTYFDIAYRDKIEAPAIFNIFSFEKQYQGTDVITRDPTPEQIQAVCDRPDFSGSCVGSFGAIIDFRVRNLAAVDVSGLDLNGTYTLGTSRGEITFALGSTYTFSYENAVTENSPRVDVAGTLGNPLKLRVRGSTSWSHNGFSASAAVSYAPSYDHPSPVSPRRIGSWATVDIGAGYEFEADGSWLTGTRIQLNATNLFDDMPPFANVLAGYDAASGNVLGRTLSLQLIRNW